MPLVSPVRDLLRLQGRSLLRFCPPSSTRRIVAVLHPRSSYPPSPLPAPTPTGSPTTHPMHQRPGSLITIGPCQKVSRRAAVEQYDFHNDLEGALGKYPESLMLFVPPAKQPTQKDPLDFCGMCKLTHATGARIHAYAPTNQMQSFLIRRDERVTTPVMMIMKKWANEVRWWWSWCVVSR